MHSRLLIICMVLGLGCTFGSEKTLSPELTHRIETLVTETMSADSIPALSVAVATRGTMSWSRAYGLQDLEAFVPAKPTTVFRLASISKSLTAVLALRLAAAGRLDLDLPIQQYVPDFPAKPGSITPRLLLGHLAGIRHYRDYGEINSSRRFARLRDALVLFQDDPLVATPGTRFAYSTFGYTLLGVSLEHACGQSFDVCLREWLLKPVGMDRTTVDDARAVIPQRARGYGRDPSGRVINTDLVDTSNKVPGGGLAGTAEDLVRFALAIRKGSLLPPELTRSMWTDQKLPDGMLTGYGLGWSIVRESPKLVGHGGGQAGATTMLLIDPDQGNVVAVLCNMEGAARVRPLAEQIMILLASSTD